MSMCKGLRAAVRSPTRRKALTAADLVSWGYSEGAEAPETYARKLSAVDRCMSILAGSMSKLPNYIFDAKTRERVDHPLLHLLNVRPNEAMTPSIRKEVLENSRNEGGNGYDWILRDFRTGRITELIPVPWYLVEPWRDLSGRIWYTVTHPVTGEPMVLPQEDICHYKGATRDGLKGISALRRAADTLASARASQQYERSYYESGGQPSGILRTESDLGGYAKGIDGKVLTRSDGSAVSLKDQLRSEWEKIHAGPKNGHRVAILDHGRVAEEGTVEEVFSRPRTEAGRRLVYPDGVPEELLRQNWAQGGGRVIRVAFNGGTAYQPLIASLAIDCGVKANILGADTRNIGGRAFGTMLLGLPEDEGQAAKALAYITSQKDITVEEVPDYHE